MLSAAFISIKTFFCFHPSTYGSQYSLHTMKELVVLSDNSLTVYKYRHVAFNVPWSTLPLAARLWPQPPYQWICVETEMIATRKKWEKKHPGRRKMGSGFLCTGRQRLVSGMSVLKLREGMQDMASHAK